MARKPSSRKDGKTPPPHAGTPLVDITALGERLLRLRQWKGYSRRGLAHRAGVDIMVISRLERQQKPRLEIETAAKLARVFKWTLDQFCGLAEAPAIPVVAPVRHYSPLDAAKPAWLHSGERTRLEDQRLAAHILVWHSRGATYRTIADTLTAWAIPSRHRDGRWDPERASDQYRTHGPWPETKKALRAFVAQYGPSAEIPPDAPHARSEEGLSAQDSTQAPIGTQDDW
jgi:transcriptional regulator with XRE-family HTH domain